MDESVGDLLPEPIRPGRRLGSKYLVGERLGRGAMGVVHEANTHDGRQLAVKFLRAELAADHKTVARFLQERHIFRKVHHPNVVEVHDLVAEGDDLAIVMERVVGGDLKQRIEARSLTPRQSMDIAHQIAAGLAAIHGASVVHRDLKPANILLTADLSPKISDFGISRLVTEAMTRTSATIGTPIYMAPESADARGADAPADVYALGIIMFELLTGRAPFTEGGTFAVLRAHAMDRPPRVEGVPAGLSDLIDQMLAKQPEARPTIDVVQARLGELLPQIDDSSQPVPVAVPIPEGAQPQAGFDSGELTGGAAGHATAFWSPPAVSGDPVVQSGDPVIRSSDPVIQSSDPVMRSGDPVANAAPGNDEATAVHPGYAAGAAGAAGVAGAAGLAAAAGAMAGPSDSAETMVSRAVSGDGAGPAGGVANAFQGLPSGDPSTSGGVPFSPAPGHGVAAPSRFGSLVPNRVPRQAIEVLVAVGSLAAVLIIAFVLLRPDGGDDLAGIGADGTETTDPSGPGTNPVGGTDNDGNGPSKFEGTGGVDGDEDGGSSTTATTDRTGTTDGSSGTTEPGGGSSSTTSTSTSSSSTSQSTTTTEATTTTTRATTSTTRPTTTSTTASTTAPTATPIQIIGGPTYDSVGPTSFHFNYTINNVCGSGSFTVTEVDTGIVAGSFSGDGSCYGPVHGGFPGLAGNPQFAGFNIKPATKYRVNITVRGVASDGSTPAGSGSDSTSFQVTTAAA